MKYDRILDLIRLWQEFEALEEAHDIEQTEAKKYDFTRFAVWLSRNVGDEKRTNTASKPSRQTKVLNKEHQEQRNREFDGKVRSGEENVMAFYKYLPLSPQIAALLGRMNRFSVFYTKKAFQGLPISSATEFGILAGIQTLGNPRKTDVINFNLLEKTTGTELIKRMIQDGLVSETDDDDDKRSKRVRLTEKGEHLAEEAVKRLWEMSEVVTGNLSDKQKEELAEMLNELEDFHANIYFHQAELSVEEIVKRNVLKGS